MPITTDYDTFATRYHGSIVDTPDARSPDEFFDALDEFFGTDDGYTHHLSRIYAMKDKIASLQASEAKLEAENEKLKADADDGDLVYSEEDLSELKEGWGEVLQDEIDELKEELDRTAYIAAAPEMRYTGDEMEEMVKIKEDIEEHPDYKETIDGLLSDYEDDIKKLKAENEKLKEFALGYWSAGQLGNCEAWDRPDEWQEQLDGCD